MIPMQIEDQLWTEAVEYFGSEEKAFKWFKSPNLALGGEEPRDYCISQCNGTQKVRDIINQLKYGMTS